MKHSSQEIEKAIHAQDMARLQDNFVKIDGDFDDKEHHINAKNTITNWFIGISCVVLLALTFIN